MSLASLLKHSPAPLSKVALCILVAAYLLLLNLATSRDIGAALFYGVWPALLTLAVLALLALAPRQVLKAVMAAFIAVASAALFFKFKYQIVITEDIMLSAWQNDLSLSLEMVSFNLLLWLAATAALPIALVVRARIKPAPFRRQLINSAAVCLLAAGGIAAIFHFGGFQLREQGNIRDPKIANSLAYFSPVDAIYSAREARRSYVNFQRQYGNVALLSEKYRYALADDMRDALVVVIVGETARGDRFSLNGYARNTNPRLATVKNLHSFSNVSSCDTITIRSLKCVFGRVGEQSGGAGIESSFVEVLRSVGMSADIYALQGMTDMYSYLGYDKLVSKYAVLARSKVGAKDQALLPFLREAVDAGKGGQLVVLHTLGSHQTYDDRLGAADKHFQPSCANPDVKSCSRAELNNAYDNTIVATDAFIYEAIKLLEHRKAVLLYVSDHGESLGENDVYYHGLPPEVAPKEQFSVPLMVWLSPPLADTALGRRMTNHLDKLDRGAHYSHTNFFHSVLGCAGVSSSDGGLDEGLNLCGAAAPPIAAAPHATASASHLLKRAR